MAIPWKKKATAPIGPRGLIRRDLLKLEAYQAIALPGALEEDAPVGLEEAIKLDGNENPYGCSPRVQQALAACQTYHIYPDPEQRELREALGRYVGLDARHIVVGAGSDELIDLILRLVLEPGDRVVNCVPTFGMYRFSTEVCGGQVVEVPRSSTYDVDVAAVLSKVDSRTKVIFIASPNNPTGGLTPEGHLLALLDTGALVVVDEAYHEFCGRSMVSHVPSHPNLVVLRTFSKWAGLAGLRLGYGAFPRDIAEAIMLIKPPYNINAAARVAALESLKDLDYLMATVRAIVVERERLYRGLQGIPFLEPLPSQANFILCRVRRGDARGIQRELRKRGIFIRYFDTPMLRDFVRISVGKPEHTDRLLEGLAALEP